MTFLIPCPNCGAREVGEFSFGGEITDPATAEMTDDALARVLYFRRNVQGLQTERWYHRYGCRRWLVAVRDTTTNEVEGTFWPNERRIGSR